MRDTVEILGQTVEFFFMPPPFTTEHHGRAAWLSIIDGKTYGDFVRVDDWAEDEVRAEARAVLLEQCKETIKLILKGVIQDYPLKSANQRF